MKIIKFESDPPLTPFAPWWCWVMGEDNSFNDSEFFDKLAKTILSKEKQTIDVNTEQYNEYNRVNNIIFDGATGLGEHSLTSRSHFFNVLKWGTPETDALKKFIRMKYDEFLSYIKVEGRPVYIQCWANVMRDGEQIKQHIHASHPLTWIGGHITVACSNTSTFYVNPMMRAEGKQVYESPNEVGKITFFQNNIPHYTNTHHGNTERISIAFDIIPKERYDSYPDFRKANFIEF